MFSSLRSRLWMSYALLIFAALLVAVLFLLVYLIRNPLIVRQATARLQDAESLILSEQPNLGELAPDSLPQILRKYDQTLNVRLLVITKNLQVLADSRAGSAPAFVAPRLLRLNALLKDETGEYWLFIAKRISNQHWLVISAPRPKVPILGILRDDLLPPFIEAGALALILSLGIAFWLARWVADPLQSVMTASQQMPARQAAALPLRGPREVQSLTRAFNAMADRLQASQRSQREFVANVSHELKTPLTSIQGFAQAILDGTASTTEAHQQAARVIYDEAGRMHRMVLDLLDLARLDAGTVDLQRASLDLLALLNNVVEKFSLQASAAGVSLKVQADALPEIIGDGDRLAQVFTNLVDNALKYTPPSGQVSLQARQIADCVEIAVTDTGTGIPPTALPHIFDRFYQADPTRKGGEKHGAGLGLAIVKEIIAAHGGTTNVRSVSGEGSTFTVRLPFVMPTDTSVVKQKK